MMATSMPLDQMRILNHQKMNPWGTILIHKLRDMWSQWIDSPNIIILEIIGTPVIIIGICVITVGLTHIPMMMLRYVIPL